MKFLLFFILNFNLYVFLSQTPVNCESARKTYLEKYPDVKSNGADPWTHYTMYGKNEGRIWPNCDEDLRLTEDEFNELTKGIEPETPSQRIRNRYAENAGNPGTNRFVIPSSVLEISSALDQINDTLDKITYLNNLISHVKKKSPNERTDWDLSMYQASFNYKLFIILPNKCNDPRISQDEWISLNDFLNLLGDEAYKSEDSKVMRGCFLYFNILVKQKLGNNSVDIKWPKMVVNEFTESNFPFGSLFYKECQRVVAANDISNKNSLPKQDPVKPKSDPPLLANEPVGTIWYDANKGGKNVRFEKLSSQKYCLTWRNSYGDVHKLTAVLTSKRLVTREESIFCGDYYEFTFTGEGSYDGEKIVFAYNDNTLCGSKIQAYDELGSRWGYWSGLSKK